MKEISKILNKMKKLKEKATAVSGELELFDLKDLLTDASQKGDEVGTIS
jgi:hypothetical protein